MEPKNKVLTYLGFAIKSGNLRSGVNAIATIRKPVYLMIICKTASENTFAEAQKLALKFKCPLTVSNVYLVENLVNKQNCKLLALTDKSLSSAILSQESKDFTLYLGGHKG